MRGQEVKQTEFSCRNVRMLAAYGQRERIRIKLKIRSRDIGGNRLLKAAEHSIYPGDELAGAEWLADIVIGAEFKAFDAVLLGCFGGKEDDGNFSQIAAFPNALAHFKAATARHHYIQ